MHDLRHVAFAVECLAGEPELRHHTSPLRRALAEHLDLVHAALWALYQLSESKGTEEEADAAIRAVLRSGAELSVLVADGQRIVDELTRLLAGQKVENET